MTIATTALTSTGLEGMKRSTSENSSTRITFSKAGHKRQVTPLPKQGQQFVPKVIPEMQQARLPYDIQPKLPNIKVGQLLQPAVF